MYIYPNSPTKHTVLKELKKHSKETKATLRADCGCPGRMNRTKDRTSTQKLEEIQNGATLVKHLGNPFGSTWIQKLITTKLR